MIKGIPVTILERVQTGVDGFHAPTYAETPVTVENVLVAPTTAEDVVTEQQLYGKHSVYTLYIPKGDSHTWTDRRISFFGEDFRSFGPVQEYIEDNVPGPWNRKVMVERYE